MTHEPDRYCNVCDGGLGYCKRCGGGEVELETPCAVRLAEKLGAISANFPGEAMINLELECARLANPRRWASAHEGFAVLLEEVDELKAEVWKREQKRDYKAMQREAVQVAAMAIRFLEDVCFPQIREIEAEEERTGKVAGSA